jgi:D-apiose dehydrogenase
MTNSRKQKVAVVGCGVFGQNHIQAWHSLDGAELVAVCDGHPERAREASELVGGVPSFTDISAMLEATSPDVVDIITSPRSHRALAEICAAHRTNAIIQKPLAMAFADSIAVADLARKAGVTMMVHENFRFQRPIREVKKIIQSGEIGTPRYCSVNFRTSYKVFPRDVTLQNGERLVLMDVGVHVFDVARFLMGNIVDLACKTLKKSAGSEAEDMASAVVGFSGGAMGIVQTSSSSLLPNNRGIDTLISVEGDTGGVVLGYDGKISVRTGDNERTFSARPEQPSWGNPRSGTMQDSVVETCRHWIEAANGVVPLELSVDDNLNTLAAVEACYISAASGGTLVKLDQILSASRKQD